jgi:transcriptional regulator with XRE-family HTH domain
MDDEIKKYLIAVDKTIGQKIEQSRILFNISRKELAKVIDVSPQQLYKYENGKNRISVGRLSLIAKKFYKDLNYFIDKKDKPQRTI